MKLLHSWSSDTLRFIFQGPEAGADNLAQAETTRVQEVEDICDATANELGQLANGCPSLEKDCELNPPIVPFQDADSAYIPSKSDLDMEASESRE